MLELISIDVSKGVVDQLYREGKVYYEAIHDQMAISSLIEGSYVILKANQSSSAIGVMLDDFIELVRPKDFSYQGVKPRDSQQICAFHSFKSFDLTILEGSAGTGKTTLAVAYAVEMLFKRGKRIVLSKPTTLVGQKSNAIAAIPGDHREKLAGYIDSFLGAFHRVMGENYEHHVYEWEEAKRLEFVPLELTRGRQFDDAIVIIDEAQNTSPHELLTFISRVSDSSQLIILGDPLQIDTDSKYKDCGMGALVNSESVAESDIASGVKLTAQYRSGLAELSGSILREMYDENNLSV